MTLTLTIENFDSLPDGGPLSVTLTGNRGIDIGRDQYLDWTLPDPDRVISGKHAEIRHRDGGYWLYDVSRNGTYLNRSSQRLNEPSRLRDGDRIEIGRYIIRVHAEESVPSAPASGPIEVREARDVWEESGEIAAPIPSRELRPPASSRPVRPDFIDWAVDLPSERSPRGSQPEAEMDWARATREPAAPLPPRTPTPRRPVVQADANGSRCDDASARPGAGVPAAKPPVEANAWGTSELRIGHRPDPQPLAADDPPALLPAALARTAMSADDVFVRRFAAGLGIAPEGLSWQEPGDLAEEAGMLIRLCADNLKQLLAARAESKRTAKAVNQTTIQALDNNPLKFAPTVDDALRIMLGRPSSGYLGARPAIETGFRDLKTHQVKTYAAMQNALRLLLEEVSPEGVESSDEKDKGLSGLLGSRKARLWDIYATRWNALASPHEDGMVDAFMLFFADCYDRTR